MNSDPFDPANVTGGAGKILGACHGLSEFVGRVTAWMVVAMVALTVYDVFMRYLFRSGSVAAQELEWHLFGFIILLGASYTLKHREHVRVDLIYASRRVSDRQRLLIDVFGHLCFLLPFSILIVWSSIPFAWDAFSHQEISPDPGGLPARWVLKAAIPAGFALLAVQALAEAVGGVLRLLRKD